MPVDITPLKRIGLDGLCDSLEVRATFATGESMDAQAMWERYKSHFVVHAGIGLRMDVSRMKFGPTFFNELQAPIERAFHSMQALESGAIANPDEKRQVGHYWLRNPSLAPSKEIRGQIESALAQVKAFASDVHSGKIAPPSGSPYTDILHIGIGGSALGPQLADCALGSSSNQLRIHFLDNTDPSGFVRIVDGLGDRLKTTLAIVASKSGGTKETKNAMLEAQAAFQKAGLNFASQAVAITGEGSTLSKIASKEGWLAQFPMWSWVGGRTSQLSVVGLLPAALQGFDIDSLLAGARACDEVTRLRDPKQNPAMLLALMWLYAGSGGDSKDMVVLPYKDSLALMTRYLQQLIMESLGKGRDLAGSAVHQGITVYGNKGSTDQHAYVQQLREGPNNFFVTFIDVMRDGVSYASEVEDGGITSGDYLLGFMLGTRHALYENDRESITLTLDEMSPHALGVLIALYERAVGFYAALVGINAYHQPGVEAGKKAANVVISLQKRVLKHLKEVSRAQTLEEIANALNARDEIETVFKLLEHLAANPERGIFKSPGKSPFDATYGIR